MKLRKRILVVYWHSFHRAFETKVMELQKNNERGLPIIHKKGSRTLTFGETEYFFLHERDIEYTSAGHFYDEWEGCLSSRLSYYLDSRKGRGRCTEVS